MLQFKCNIVGQESTVTEQTLHFCIIIVLAEELAKESDENLCKCSRVCVC